MLIEILVSAMVLTIASAGVILLLQTTTRSQAELRNNSQAYALAQEDQARLTSMRLATLNRLDQTRTVTVNQTQFQVRSRGVFINDSTSTPSCGEGTSSADYVEITSSVTWNGMDPGEKAKIVSVLSPSNGSLDPNHGTIAFSVKTQAQAPVPNAFVYGGSGAFSGYTDAFGCAVFTDLPAGDYDVSVSGEGIDAVNEDGEYVQEEEITVVGGDTKTVTYEFDRPGTIPVKFKWRIGSSGNFAVGTAASVVAYNAGMGGGAKPIWTPSGSPAETVEAKPLFPFSSSYYLYAGSCGGNDPEPSKNPSAVAATANVVAPIGATASTATLQIPALELVVKKSGVPLQGATVTITDTECDNAQGSSVKRTYTTNKDGLPSNPLGAAELGLPWGIYDLCASVNISGTNRRERMFDVPVKNLAAATTKTIELSSGDTSGSC